MAANGVDLFPASCTGNKSYAKYLFYFISRVIGVQSSTCMSMNYFRSQYIWTQPSKTASVSESNNSARSSFDIVISVRLQGND